VQLVHDPFDRKERELVSRFWGFIDNELSVLNNAGDMDGQSTLGGDDKPTEKQVRYLRGLGFKGSIDGWNWKQVSDKIKELKGE